MNQSGNKRLLSVLALKAWLEETEPDIKVNATDEGFVIHYKGQALIGPLKTKMSNYIRANQLHKLYIKYYVRELRDKDKRHVADLLHSYNIVMIRNKNNGYPKTDYTVIDLLHELHYRTFLVDYDRHAKLENSICAVEHVYSSVDQYNNPCETYSFHNDDKSKHIEITFKGRGLTSTIPIYRAIEIILLHKGLFDLNVLAEKVRYITLIASAETLSMEIEKIRMRSST